MSVEELFPSLDPLVARVVMHEPCLCRLHELNDGTYSIDDFYDFVDMMNYRAHCIEVNKADVK